LTTTPFFIEHALVMDTDHLPGGGGYAVVGMSAGVGEAERVFVSENFGISDFLHDPENARVYFSVLRAPGARTAFVRRFANGTRRGGTQNRMFVHTLFLDDPLLDAVYHLPWILTDQPFRLAETDTYLTLDVEPLVAAGFPPLEWRGSVSDGEAFEQLRIRYEQFGKRLTQSGEYAGLDGFDAIAAVMEAVRAGRHAVLPQGMLFEQLSLVAWSMLPPPDRLALSWTQHDSRNSAFTFGIANAEMPGDESFVDLRARASEATRQAVMLNTRSAESWADLHSTTARLGISLRSGDIDWWLRWRDSLEDLLANPLASDEELVPKLERVAKSVRSNRREAWIDEMEVLRFLLAVVNRAIDKGQSRQNAVQRWNGLFQRTGIAEVVFRRPPPQPWLDESEKRIGADLVVECFMAGSEQLPAAEGTRTVVAEWLLQGQRLETVSVSTAGRLIERLAAGRSPLAGNLIDATLRRPRALRELAAVLPAKKRELGRTIIDIVLSAIRLGEKDAGWFAEQLLLPQLEVNEELRLQVSLEDAQTLAAALRARPESYALFAAYMPKDVAQALAGQAERWLAEDQRAGLPIARQILELVNRRSFPNVALDGLALSAAEAGEPARLWLPAAIDRALVLDTGNATEARAFIARVRKLAPRAKREDNDAIRQVVAALRQLAGERRRIGACMRELVMFTRWSWSSAGPALPEALEAAIALPSARAAEWSDAVTELVKMHARPGVPASAVVSLLGMFWQRLAPADFGAIPESLIDALESLDDGAATALVTRWLLLVRALPALAAAEHFLDVLGDLASDEQYWELAVERSWREIEFGIADAGTLCRLESARSFTRKRKGGDVPAAIVQITQDLSAADRAAWLLLIAAAPDTQPVTRRIIETRFLPGALRLVGTDWRDFLGHAGDDLFAHGNILLMVARELALSNPSPALRQEFESMCRARDRDDAVQGVARPVPRGLAEQASVWLGGDLGS
jgi:hypothetical protein